MILLMVLLAFFRFDLTFSYFIGFRFVFLQTLLILSIIQQMLLGAAEVGGFIFSITKHLILEFITVYFLTYIIERLNYSSLQLKLCFGFLILYVLGCSNVARIFYCLPILNEFAFLSNLQQLLFIYKEHYKIFNLTKDIKKMLKNLLTKIKTQKLSTVSNEEPQQQYQKQKLMIQKPYNKQQLSRQLCKASSVDSIIISPINLIHYFTSRQIPNIFFEILGCPISFFNQLTHSKRKVKQIDLVKQSFPQYLDFMKSLLQQELPSFNHILINHYPKGIGIMPHFDGPLYRNKVVVLSLGGPAIIGFNSGYQLHTTKITILLEHNSIHIFQQTAYQNYLHGIQNNKIDSILFTIQKQLNKLHNNQCLMQFTHQQNKYCVVQSSIQNFSKCQMTLRPLIQKYLPKLTLTKNSQSLRDNQCIQFDYKQQKYQKQNLPHIKGCFLLIKNDPLDQQKQNSSHYKWKLQIQRQQRISITFRQKYSQIK